MKSARSAVTMLNLDREQTEWLQPRPPRKLLHVYIYVYKFVSHSELDPGLKPCVVHISLTDLWALNHLGQVHTKTGDTTFRFVRTLLGVNTLQGTEAQHRGVIQQGSLGSATTVSWIQSAQGDEMDSILSWWMMLTTAVGAPACQMLLRHSGYSSGASGVTTLDDGIVYSSTASAQTDVSWNPEVWIPSKVSAGWQHVSTCPSRREQDGSLGIDVLAHKRPQVLFQAVTAWLAPTRVRTRTIHWCWWPQCGQRAHG